VRAVRVGLLTLALLLAVGVGPARAQSLQIAACPTILSSLVADHQATRELFRQYGPVREANPVVRALGPDLYFATWTFGVAALCKENTAWRVASVVIWAVQTWAVGTHERTGTVRTYPVLYLVFRW